jgi:hypothetical protein
MRAFYKVAYGGMCFTVVGTVLVGMTLAYMASISISRDLVIVLFKVRRGAKIQK